MKQIAKRIAALAASVLLCLPLFGCQHVSYLDNMIGELNRISEEAGLSYQVEEQIRTTDRGTVWITFREWGEAASYSTLHITSDDQGRDLKKGYSFSIYNDVSEPFVIDCLTGLYLLEEPETAVEKAQEQVTAFWATKSKVEYSDFLDCGQLRWVLSPYYNDLEAYVLNGVSWEQLKEDFDSSSYQPIQEGSARNSQNVEEGYWLRGRIISEPYTRRYMLEDDWAVVLRRFEVMDENGGTYTLQYYKANLPVEFQKGDTFQFYGTLNVFPKENEKGYPLLWLDWFEE